MIILTHIIIALASIALATGALVAPTRKKLATSYGFIAATIASGMVLLMVSPSSSLHACVTGTVYLAAVSVVTIATHRRIRQVAQTVL